MGLTNYASAYATGLLLARRHLLKIGLAETYKGLEEANGDDYNVEKEGQRAPFRAVLDVGLARTVTGAKVFAVMKGAADGGIDVPHRCVLFCFRVICSLIPRFETDVPLDLSFGN